MSELIEPSRLQVQDLRLIALEIPRTQMSKILSCSSGCNDFGKSRISEDRPLLLGLCMADH
jgi:hypothetical protein